LPQRWRRPPFPRARTAAPLRLVGPDGQRSLRSSRRIAVGRGGVARGGFEARVAGRKAYVDTTRRATLDVFVGAARCGAGHAGHIHQARTAPGWQSGGAPVDALPSLTAWDAAS